MASLRRNTWHAHPRIITSPLSGPFTEGNTTVDVQIYRLEDSLWTLEVIDVEGSSTVWDDEFVSAAAAKAELRSVAEEGLVGSRLVGHGQRITAALKRLLGHFQFVGINQPLQRGGIGSEKRSHKPTVDFEFVVREIGFAVLGEAVHETTQYFSVQFGS